MTGRAVLVVGAGVIGLRHLRAVVGAGDRVVAVVDGDRARAQAAADEFGGTAFTELTEALGAGADTAILATPSTVHLSQSVQALEAGLDVLVEKPHRVPDQRPAALAAAIEGRRYMVGMTTRHWPGIRALAAALQGGELGQVLSYDDRMHFRLGPDDLAPWYFDRSVSGGGILLTNGVHALDRARALLGSPLSVVQQRFLTVFPDHECEDSAELTLVTSDGVPVRLSMLWSPVEPLGGGLTVTGTAGVAQVAPDGSWRLQTETSERAGGAIHPDEPFAAQWRAFVAGEPGFGHDDLEPTLQLIEQCYREAGA
jgi:predicted dehydrogenase